MVGVGDVADGIVAHRRLVIVALLLLVGAVGAGAPQVEESSSLSQFETDSVEAEKLSYVESEFTGAENATTAQVVVRGENVLSKSALERQLRFQRTLAENRTVNRTLSDDQRPAGVANVVATSAIREEQAANLSERGRALRAEQERLNRTGERLSDALNRTRGLQQRYDALNRSHANGEVDDETYQGRATALERNLTAVRERATANLSADQTATFDDLFTRTRALQSRLDSLNASYAAGEINETAYRERSGEVQAEFAEVYGGIEAVLAPEAAALEARAAELERDQQRLRAQVENGSMPPLSAQTEKLSSMNESAVEATVERVLDRDSDAGAFALMPTGYDPGSTSAEASMIVVTQTEVVDTAEGMSSDRIANAQIAMQDLAERELGDRAMVFGQGIITDELDRSMQDSLLVVGPFAVLFVLVVLTVAYRDPVDILLGLLGIGLVLLLTFGVMGWADIAFNQLFVAIPVLLIGLSIDYAIHVFMRHREEREGADVPVAGSMRTALAGVGTALVLVTATTAIGFLSNLTSPVGPIREFGLVSAAGIAAALVVFGGLMPAIKVEIDGLLERYGVDRRKRAFGTGGGAFGRLLGVGATAARRSPGAVIAITLLVSAAGAYGATGVDTSFSNEEFIAEEPPEWMDSLPEAIRPGEYSMRATFEYVNDNFLREDSKAEFLFEGEVATADALDRVNRTRTEAASKNATVTLSNDEADIRSPLTVMESVAATNESFNATFAAADTDGDGVPDRNVEGVYDALFATAPDRAREVVHRGDDEYRALRLTVSLDGGASGQAVTDQMNAVEHAVKGGDVTVTATGTPIVQKIVQDDLLETVVESLIITLAASFVFLMVVYRITQGSATLGLVTLLPVAFNVAWILGTMFLLDIPFNLLTGMITSLTIGLGVAYSIHISERYSLELGRQGSAWDALDTAVTGTGGALLGSAATTVGGFGVLVFAILPPLQQFGFITGLTIVYAFLASVFVLPSLLVVWTRYVGPSEALDAGDATGPDFPGDALADSAPGPDRAVANGAPASNAHTGEAGAHGNEAGARGNGTGPAGAAAAAARAGTVGDETPVATRSVEPSRVLPGGTATVTVALTAASGRVVLSESVSDGSARVDDVSPTPVERVAADGRVYAVWDLDEGTRARLQYTVTVPEAVADGRTVGFDGELLLPDHVVPVAGADAVTVTTDVADSILSGDAVADRDVADAGSHLDAGDISAAEFERVYHAWLDQHATERREAETDD